LLLTGQIHHWAADLFVAAIMAHMLRIFFTGAYRKPREINWLIGLVMFTFALFEGLFGYAPPTAAARRAYSSSGSMTQHSVP
jgi:ubiquinol-cytochrome c reductase cytochrome b subunit